MFACMFALYLVPEAPRVLVAAEAHAERAAHVGRHWLRSLIRVLRILLGRLIEVFKELIQMVWSRRGLTALILCFLPIGSAAAQGIFSGQIATDWGAPRDEVEVDTFRTDLP